MDQLKMKQQVAKAALDYIKIQPQTIIGIGSGSTVNCFIEQLDAVKHNIDGAVAASVNSENLLKELGIEILTANDISSLDVYVDGADEINQQKMMIKGGGAALTREKILASLAKKFVCIIDQSKQVDILGSTFPLPIEVIPMARSAVARQLVKLGGLPEYREGIITDNGNIILDIHNFKIMEPMKMEALLNDIPGVVTNGIFALRSADVVLVASESGINIIE